METASGGISSSTSGGISSLIQTTKTKLMVLSSLLGVGAIIYFTRNYLKQGQFIPSWSTAKKQHSKHPTVIGGKRTVVIKEDEEGMYILFDWFN